MRQHYERRQTTHPNSKLYDESPFNLFIDLGKYINFKREVIKRKLLISKGLSICHFQKSNKNSLFCAFQH